MGQERHHEAAQVPRRVGKRTRRQDVELRGAVLEPAPEVDRLVDDVEEDRVVVVRRAAEQRVLRLRDLLEVGTHVARDGR